MLTVFRLAEDHRGVLFEALVGDLEPLLDDRALKIVRRLGEQFSAYLVLRVVHGRKLVHAEHVPVPRALAQFA